jgi:transcriptional regulator with XRE-family HTH domain
VRAETDTDAGVYHTIAERIEAACRALNIKQRELAERAGLPTRQLLTQIKSGERPGRKHVEALAGVMGSSVEWLTTGTGKAPSWASPRPAHLARESGQTYDAPVETYDAPVEAPPWAVQLLAEVQALRAEVAGLRAAPVDTTTPLPSVPREEARRRIRHGRAQTEKDHAPLPIVPLPPRPVVLEDDDAVSIELDRILDPDEHPRPEAPTYPRTDSIPDRTPHGR